MRKFVLIEECNNDFIQCVGIFTDYRSALAEIILRFTDDMDIHNAEKAVVSSITRTEGDTGYMFSWEFGGCKNSIYILEFNE